MARGWNRIVAENDPFVAQQWADGTLTQGLRITMCDEDVEAARQGYKCLGCLENLESAYDCPNDWCPFGRMTPAEMERTQKELFATAFKGHIPGARTGADWEAAADRIEERKERRAFEKRARESNIVVPKAIV